MVTKLFVYYINKKESFGSVVIAYGVFPRLKTKRLYQVSLSRESEMLTLNRFLQILSSSKFLF